MFWEVRIYLMFLQLKEQVVPDRFIQVCDLSGPHVIGLSASSLLRLSQHMNSASDVGYKNWTE